MKDSGTGAIARQKQLTPALRYFSQLIITLGAMAPTFADLAKSQYVLLTTFTKDGRPKPTPVWAAPDSDRLLVITQEKSWKVRRIRNTPRVTLAVCDMRGNAQSEAVEGTATILDKSHNGAVYDALVKRYGLIARVFNFFSKLRGGMQNNVGLELRPLPGVL